MDRRHRTRDGNSPPDPALLRHLRSLGLETVDEYVDWCGRNGFTRRLDKPGRQRAREVDLVRRVAADDRLARSRREQHRPDKALARICRGELREADVSDPALKAVCRAYGAAQVCGRTRQAFLDLVQHLHGCSELVSARAMVVGGRHVGNTLVDGLLALARHARHWVRPVAAWKPATHNARRQFSSLARHLCAEWPVPAFLDAVWFAGNRAEGRRWQEWFLHVGRGRNIRTADLPLPYTKRMAHHFLLAPSDLCLYGALRWGQVLGLGGDARLARAVVGTRLRESFSHHEFWTSVLQFFVAHPTLNRDDVGPIVDYIHFQRFVPCLRVDAPGVETYAPEQPNFTMKGRTPASLLRQVERWHRSLTRVDPPAADWPRSGIADFEFLEGGEDNLRVWTIRELLCTKELAAEGRRMRHCVAMYGFACTTGRSSIWTMEVDGPAGRSKLLTIEVQTATRTVCQARGKYNAPPDDRQRTMLRRWAEQAGLRVASYV